MTEQDWIDKYRQASQAAQENEAHSRGAGVSILEWLVTLHSRIRMRGFRQFIGRLLQPAPSATPKLPTLHAPNDRDSLAER